MYNITAQELQDYIHAHIPISRAMGLKIEQAAKDKVILSAPITLNINHKKTVFGGSLQSISTLACWSLVFINLKDSLDNIYEIVIYKSEIKYLRPVTKDFRVQCEVTNKEEFGKFQNTLLKRSKGRISLVARIYQDGVLAVDYKGEFVAIRL